MVLEFAALIELASKCAPSVAPRTIAAIVEVESGFEPYAINVNNGAHLAKQPASKAEAVAEAEALLADGANIDMGLGQINSKNLEWLSLSVEDAFEPCTNLTAAGKVLEAGFLSFQARGSKGQGALQMALSAYNTGNHSRGFENGYVQKVLDASRRVVPDITGTELLKSAAEVAIRTDGSEAAESPPLEHTSLNVFQSEQAKRVNLFD